ncbi:MAG: ABC transporter ATP-binding protein [Defluviitaleaceae bacterium]|nr:ABC transporter ATP-binding protein [Defluviitaleaceae bacterium]
MSKTLVSIKSLRSSYKIAGEYYAAVDNVDLDIMANETIAIVGESGCGKSCFALSLLKLHNMDYTRIEGNVNYNGINLVDLSESALDKVRGKEVGMIFQDPLTALNPLHKIGRQLEEGMTYHTTLNAEQRKEKAMKLLDDVGINNPTLTYNSFPYELSGGMRQRIMIAIALSCEPSLLIADEPTTALDVTIQAQILDLMREVQEKTKSSLLLITHDLGVVAEMADRVAVMYAGQIVELATAEELFSNPLHPYTRSLLSSIPGKSAEATRARLNVIQGTVPTLLKLPREGCRFSHRIPWIDATEHEADPALREALPNHFVRCTCYRNFHFSEG